MSSFPCLLGRREGFLPLEEASASGETVSPTFPLNLPPSLWDSSGLPLPIPPAILLISKCRVFLPWGLNLACLPVTEPPKEFWRPALFQDNGMPPHLCVCLPAGNKPNTAPPCGDRAGRRTSNPRVPPERRAVAKLQARVVSRARRGLARPQAGTRAWPLWVPTVCTFPAGRPVQVDQVDLRVGRGKEEVVISLHP